MTQLLGRYSGAYAGVQSRRLTVLQVAAGEDEPRPDGPAPRTQGDSAGVPGLHHVRELSELNKACQGRSFTARRDAAIIAVFSATGIRLAELAGIRYHPGDPARSDLDLQAREIRIRGKGGTGPDR